MNAQQFGSDPTDIRVNPGIRITSLLVEILALVEHSQVFFGFFVSRTHTGRNRVRSDKLTDGQHHCVKSSLYGGGGSRGVTFADSSPFTTFSTRAKILEWVVTTYIHHCRMDCPSMIEIALLSVLTRDINIAILSVCPSVTFHSFFTTR